MTPGSGLVTQRLGFRLAVLMAMALLPLGIVAYAQTRNLGNEAQARAEAALLGATLRAAAGEVGAIQQARGLVQGLAAVIPDVADDTARCVATLAEAQQHAGRVTLLAYVPVSGLMTCSSTGQAFDYSRNPQFIDTLALRDPFFIVNRNGPVTGESVLGIEEPVFDGEGTKIGSVSAWLPHSRLSEGSAKDLLGAGGADPSSISFWTFDRQGEVLTSSLGLEGVDKVLPAGRDLAELARTREGVFRDTTASGEPRTYAVVPLAEGDLYLMSSWNAKAASRLEQWGVDPRLFPLLMWVAGFLVSIWAAELLVGKHVRILHRSISDFASGDRRRQEIDVRGAPLELRQMAEAYLSMTDAITQDEAHLEDTIHQKDVLLREVHHRVKNNLQLIASIMNMQMRRSANPETRGLLRGLHDRIMSLATIHRGLYQTSGLADVRADELLADIVRQIVSLGSVPAERFEVTHDFEEIRLIPDQAVPLSLLLTEAMTNALKYGGAAGGQKGRIAVSLKRTGDGGARLEVTNSVGTEAMGPAEAAGAFTTGLGAQLIAAFTQQVGGRIEQGMQGDRYRLGVDFPISALSNAEFRDHPAGKLRKPRSA